MPIKSINISNVLVFQQQWRIDGGDPKAGVLCSGDQFYNTFQLNFSDGINVLIGGNGVGKTSILKMIYAATQWTFQSVDLGKTDSFNKFFSNHISDSDVLKSQNNSNGYCGFDVSDGVNTFTYSLSHKGFLGLDKWLGLDIQSVFIPTTEMLSHSKGFLALNHKYGNLPFDGTQVDIIVNASLPTVREIPLNMEPILKRLSEAIDGEVVQENDIFYVIKHDGRKVDFSLEAEGLRKLGLLWKLIRNGLLVKDSILLWDEPEANLDPALFPLVVDILLELQKSGIQIFVATHSYNFAKYLEILHTEINDVRFFNLYKGKASLPKKIKNALPEINSESSEVIYSSSADTLEGLGPNHIMQADIDLLDKAYGL